MNPALLKPRTTVGAQVVVQSKPLGGHGHRACGKDEINLLPDAVVRFSRLAKTCEVIVIKSAGSPAETNLRAFP